jgi:hypothetical protein
VGTSLSGSGSAPTLATQFGSVNLNPVFGSGVGAQPAFNNGIISIGSNTTIAGFSFTNTSITNYSTSNVLIANNTFTGSFTDNPTDLATAQAFGPINVSANALPAIQLVGVSNLTIANNTFIYPQAQTYQSQSGQDGNFVCNQSGINPDGFCLSANAIRLNNSTNATISNNNVTGALDEAFRINNPTGTLLINNNTISEMRMGPDSNIGSAIIIGQNQGSSTIQILNNSISNNSRGVYSVVTAANQSNIAVDTNGKNVIDPIEIGLCRGSVSYPRTQDLYASPDFSGNCASPTSMNLTISGNQISLPAITSGRQDGDGIDLNIGANAILRATINNNSILTLGDPETNNIGDNGLTFDIRGNSDVAINIRNNFIKNSGDAAIGFSLQNTPFANQPGSTDITISGNTFGPGVSPTVEADLVDNAGSPVSVFKLYGSGDNELLNSNVIQQSFNEGFYPNLFVNNVRLQGNP